MPFGNEQSGEGEAIPSLATSLLTLNGVNTVMAMAYKLPVNMVQQFFSYFYESLLRGERCSVAVYCGRSVFLNWENRDLTRVNFPYLDWMIPVAYTKAIITPDDDNTLPLMLAKSVQRADNGADVNYIGRDEVIYLLDRLTSKNEVIHLSGLTGQGKSTAYREFLWWKNRTGDTRQQIWIDFEKIRTKAEFLQLFTSGTEDLLMVWDHADDINILSLPEDFQILLQDIVRTHSGSILTAGRQDRPIVTSGKEVKLTGRLRPWMDITESLFITISIGFSFSLRLLRLAGNSGESSPNVIVIVPSFRNLFAVNYIQKPV